MTFFNIKKFAATSPIDHLMQASALSARERGGAYDEKSSNYVLNSPPSSYKCITRKIFTYTGQLAIWPSTAQFVEMSDI